MAVTEQKDRRQPLLMEQAANWLIVKIRENKVPILASAGFGALAYGFAFTNKLVNHDEVFCLFSKGATVSSGRWGLGALDSIFPNYSMPWIYGIFSIALITAAICLVIRIFDIQSKLLQVLTAGSILVFPSLIGTFGYMFTSSSYALSFLLAVLAVWLLQKPSKFFTLPALACMVLSLSIYQSYIAIAASLLVLVLIRQLLQGEKAGKIICKGLFFVAFLIASLGLYWVGTKVVLRITGTQFGEYASDSIVFTLSSIPSGIGLAYSSFFRFLAEGYCGLIPTALSRLAHFLFIAATVVLLLIRCVRQKRNTRSCLLLFLLIALLPLAINCMYIITTADSIHTLVLYGFVAVYLLGIIAADICLPSAGLMQRAALDIAAFAMALIVLVNTYLANEAYLNLYLRYENAYAFYTTLLADIRMTPGFDADTKLALVGYWQEPDFYSEEFAVLDQFTGVKGFTANSYSGERFLEYYLGSKVPFASEAEIAAIQNTPEYEAMAVYPYYGSMAMIGDILVVKLS